MDDRGGLENRCGFWVTVGSNPTPSASEIGLSTYESPFFFDYRRRNAQR